MDGLALVADTVSAPEVNALVNVIQLAILVAILRWVTTHDRSEPRRRPEDDHDEPHKPA